MDEAFSQALVEWTAYYTLMGGAGATLLGLLFVAVSLRLNIFHAREVADVRDFATFTFGSFLVTIVVAGLALAPHERRETLALPVALAGLVGLAAEMRIARTWYRLNRSAIETPSSSRYALLGGLMMAILATPNLGLIVVSWLLAVDHPAALSWLAVVEAVLLVFGTAAAWLMLSHAGNKPSSASDD